jgi:Ca2+-binding RTX toxin-like protein
MRFKIKRLHWVLAAAAVAAIALPVGSSASASHVPKCLDETPTVVGTAGDDVLVGTSDDDVIVGLGGNDTIDGLDGIDLICGNEGNDDIDGGPGIDGLVGGPGDDRLDGSESEGLFGEDPDFALYNDAPAPIQASLTTGIATGDGTDTLVNLEAIVGSAFGDTLEGDSSWNYVDGGPGDDSVAAGAGDDYLDGDDGNDAIDGGPGRDCVSYHYAPAAVRVDLTKGVASGWGSDRLTGVEDLAGSRFGDRLVGDGHTNHFEGGGGVDVISGVGGADILLGEKGGTS